MKLFNKISILVLSCATFFSCADLDTIPEGGTVTSDQKKDVVNAIPERLAADVSGMFSVIGNQYCVFGPKPEGSGRHDDAGYPTVCLSQDLNGPDMISDDSGYNWFSTSSEYSDRSDTYANPYERWSVFYQQIKLANDVLLSIPEGTDNPQLLAYQAQARAVRAFDYLSLAPYFQFKYVGNEDKPSVPIVKEVMEEPSNNPRATLKELYEFILADLDAAIAGLEGYSRKSKTEIDQKVAYGLRARAYLYMERWAEAYADAQKAMEGYSPYTREEVSRPAFNVLEDHNWMWGLKLSPTIIADAYPSWPAVLGSFSGDAYSTGVGCYKSINVLLFSLIPDTDVRKGWWVDENLHSDNLATVKWGDAVGDDVAKLVIADVKMAYLPYTNVKFDQYQSDYGGTVNAGDWCIMRAEEMLLIAAEAKAMSGDVAGGRQILVDFVKNYRDAAYTCTISDAKQFQDEVWKQRRIELWGEGFSMSDVMRLGKNVVRINNRLESNFPEAFQFNIAANDGWLLLRIPQKETNNNAGIPLSANNNEGKMPLSGEGKGLLDGITD